MTCVSLSDCHVLAEVSGEHHAIALLHDLAGAGSLCSVPEVTSVCVSMVFDVWDEYGCHHVASGSTGFDVSVDSICQCCCIVENIEKLICTVASELHDTCGNWFVVDEGLVCLEFKAMLNVSPLLPHYLESEIDPMVCVTHTVCFSYEDQACEYYCGPFGPMYLCEDSCDYHSIERMTIDMLKWLEEGAPGTVDPACAACDDCHTCSL
jgi:hypothetical protein